MLRQWRKMVPQQNFAKPQDSLTAPNRDHFVRVTLMVLEFFLHAITKAKKLVCESIAQNLKEFFSFGNGV